MAKGATIINNQSVDDGRNLRIPQNLVYAELDGLYGSTILRDMHQFYFYIRVFFFKFSNNRFQDT